MSKAKQKKAINLLGVVDVIATGLAVATVFGFLGRLHWVFDLFSHFRVQYMQLCLPLIGIALWKRTNKRAVLIILLAAINYAFVLPYYFGKPAAPTSPPIRAMLMNINAGNGNTEEVLSAISDANPDILLLEEVTPKWAAELAVLFDDYPHHIAKLRDDPFGIMLLSKYPLKDEAVIELGRAEVPSLIATIRLPDRDIRFIGTHSLPPMGRLYSMLRNEQLAELPALAAEQELPVLLMGDLNVTPYSYWFKRVRESGLQDSTEGFGFQPTWVVNAFLKIPIDHALHSEDITIHNRFVGPDVGSDHRPVVIDFTVQ